MFGHEPRPASRLFDLADRVCARCCAPGIRIATGDAPPIPVPVAWPCATAVVLGLAERTTP